MIALPSLHQALDAGLRVQKDEWDDSRMHISDLAVAIGEKCARQLWLRLNGAEKKPESTGILLMWDNGQRMHERLVEVMRSSLSNGWKIQAVEKQVELSGITGRFDTRLWHDGEGWEIIVDFKTLRGRAFGYLEEARPAHVLQVQAYIAAADADGGLVFYADREGQNACKQFYVARDDEQVEMAIANTRAMVSSEPDILRPQLVIAKNKGPDSVKLKQPWMCDYCQYCGPSCPGALPPKMRDLGIVGYVDNGNFTPKVKDAEVVNVVETLLDTSGYAGVPF